MEVSVAGGAYVSEPGQAATCLHLVIAARYLPSHRGKGDGEGQDLRHCVVKLQKSLEGGKGQLSCFS
jgi:hypothetical protein